MIRAMYFAVLVGILSSCNWQSKREKLLEAQTDSLRNELKISNEVAATLMEVGTLLDSIDANRGLVETNLSQEFSDENYVARLSQINRYVKSSYDKITSLEEKLRKSKASGSDYLATIKKLKNDLGEREQKIGELTAQVEAYKEETATLMNTVALQGAELSDKMDLLAARQQEVTKLQTDIQKLITSSQISLADAYYAQAEALEEAARRTKLAPRKKKKTQAEALELYRLALVTGKTEAQKKVEELEKDI